MFFSEYPYINMTDMNLDYLLKHMKSVMDAVNDLDDWRQQHETEYKQLKTLYDQIMSGNFPPSVKSAFERWMNENALEIVGSMVKNVFFGLTDSGYFVAYIPDSWDDIIFHTTGWDIETELMPDYGHLVLSY